MIFQVWQWDVKCFSCKWYWTFYLSASSFVWHSCPLEYGFGSNRRLDKRDGLGWMRWMKQRQSYLGYYRNGNRSGFGYYEWDEDLGKRIDPIFIRKSSSVAVIIYLFLLEKGFWDLPGLKFLCKCGWVLENKSGQIRMAVYSYSELM